MLMKTPENIHELIAKFFAGEEMTSLEKELFQEWKGENNAEYSKLAGLIKLFDGLEPVINVNTSMAWQRIDAKLESHPKSAFKAMVAKITMIAASFLLLLGLSFWLLQKEKVIRYKGSDTQVVDVILPDGSSVNLFPKSNLEYCFKNNKRDVVFVGKAFFEVKRDTLHPFLVQIPDVNVEVLGTSFLIDAIQPDRSAVFVKDGVVKVRAYDQEEILKSNQKVSLTKNNALYRDTILNTAIFELRQPVISLSFNKTPLKAVIEEIEKFYNVTIELRNIPEGNMITTAFNENSIDEVMNELSSLCHLKYAKISDRYFVFYTER